MNLIGRLKNGVKSCFLPVGLRPVSARRQKARLDPVSTARRQKARLDPVSIKNPGIGLIYFLIAVD